MLTNSKKETVIRSTLNQTFKTGPCVLPQRQAFEESSANTPGQAQDGATRNAGDE